MAQRLATEYKQVSLTLNKVQLTEFIRLFNEMNARLEEKVLDNGDYELTLYDLSDQVQLTFENFGDFYLLSGNCCFKDRNLAEVMRKAMSSFKGEAIVDRIFNTFKVEYRYEQGTVQSIREINGDDERYIYTNHDFNTQLLNILQNLEVDQEIERIKLRIDHLLDQRIKLKRHSLLSVKRIDQELSLLVSKIKQFEA